MYNKESSFFLENQNLLIPNEDIFSNFLNMEFERQQNSTGNDPFDTIFREYREQNVQQKPLNMEKDKVKDEKSDFTRQSQVNIKINDLLLLKKRSGKKLFDTERPQRKFSCDVELTNDVTRKNQDKYETQTIISDSNNNKTIFKTQKEDDESVEGKGDGKEMKKMMKLLKNRISAKKCRLKKKEYYDNLENKVVKLEEELEKYKKLNKQKNSVDTLLEIVK